MAQRPSSQIEVPSSNGGTGTSPSDSQSNDRPRRQFQAWHGAGIVLLLAVGGLLLYGFWPVLMGTVEEDERPEVEEAAVSGAQIEVVEVERIDFPLRAEATGRLAPWRQSAESGGRIVSRPVEEGRRVRWLPNSLKRLTSSEPYFSSWKSK